MIKKALILLRCQMQNGDYSSNISSFYLSVSLIVIVFTVFSYSQQKKNAYFNFRSHPHIKHFKIYILILIDNNIDCFNYIQIIFIRFRNY